MQHSGRVWIEAEGKASQTAGAVEVDADAIRLLVGAETVGSWPLSAVRIVDADPGFRLSAEDEAVRFVPDDLESFMSETAAIRFRSKMKPDGAASTTSPTTVSPVPQPAPIPAPVSPAPVGAHPAGLQPSAKNAGLAAVLSAVWSGLGQIYNGEIGKGVLFMIVQVVNFFLAFLIIGFFTGFAVWIWAMVDAYQTAERWNRTHGLAA